ncbi:hypothetical protein LTR28_013978 [Elasticomyces elasticus]|nr:hypothetical protein LTR28_013978 [Elasticomyces elasticus]
MIWVNHVAVQRNRDLWDEPDTFKPERFLASAASTLPKDGYRPFERGPRSCIGQELALLETKIIMALTLRRFDIHASFDDLAALANDGSVWAPDEHVGPKKVEVLGDEMYQMLKATAKPRQGMPTRYVQRCIPQQYYHHEPFIHRDRLPIAGTALEFL